MKKIIDDQFQRKAADLVVKEGVSKRQAAERLGVSRPTIRRALAALAAALAEAGQSQCVDCGMDAAPAVPAVVATYAPRVPRPRFGIRLAYA